MSEWDRIDGLNLYDFLARESQQTSNIESLARQYFALLQARLPNLPDETLVTIKALMRERWMQR